MPRLGPVQTEGCVISRKWKVRRQTTEIRNAEAGHNSGTLAPDNVADPLAFLAFPERSQGLPQTFCLFSKYDAVFPCPFRYIESFIGPAE